MLTRNNFIVIYCTIVSFAILYEQQPLLPLFAELWDRSASDVALLTTVTMVPLALAPLIYGYMIERFSARHMLLVSFTLLLLTQAFLSVASGYTIFLLLRVIEGLVLPAIFTALMTYSSAMGAHENIRQNIGMYIASTIVGGYCGRTITGVITSWFGWNVAFGFWSFMAFIAIISLTKLGSDPRNSLVKVSLQDIRLLIQKPLNQKGLLISFLLFFVFAAMLNFLPFRMLEIDPLLDTAAISMVYSGYLVGVFISLYSIRLVNSLGNERNALLVGASVYFVGTLSFIFNEISSLYFIMFVFAAGMFTLHSVLSSYLNHLEPTRKGMINGLYVSAYYSGGALGSFLPGLVYHSMGWSWFIIILLIMVTVIGWLIYLMPTAPLLNEKNQ
ncbi:MAG: MFS transporter [Gammaproteobacteria bacterium]|nr:MAG: MFS transporter [Gammaproteobacteria bacterium]